MMHLNAKLLLRRMLSVGFTRSYLVSTPLIKAMSFFPLNCIKTLSSMTWELAATSGMAARAFFWASVKVMVFPVAGYTFKSLSKMLVYSRLYSLRPEKPDSTIKSTKDPTTTPVAAMAVIILMALLLLEQKRYRFAMYSETFNRLWFSSFWE